MRKAPIGTAALALAGALTLSGCGAAGSSMEQLPPTLGGLPAAAPARPATPYQYPAVHDMPPPRETRPMSDEDVLKAEKDLEAVRDRQEQHKGGGKPPAARKKAAPAAKEHPADTKKRENTGAGTNP
ncbi:MAG TPA: hypothetical protein VG986_18050 [Pseudolabrys sp.]|nr:hypothetical protein [Pseudolabrys sp.]